MRYTRIPREFPRSVGSHWSTAFRGCGPGFEESDFILETPDGGYIVGEETFSFGAGRRDAWLFKLDVNGNIEWQKTYGGPRFDELSSIQLTPDGGYVLAGETQSFGIGSESNIENVWVVKLDMSGNPVTAKQELVEFGEQQLAAAIRLLLYNPRTVALLPLVISEAANGNYAPIAAQFHMIVSFLAESLSIGMHNAVMCTEDAPFIDWDNLDHDAIHASYMGPMQLDAIKTMCSIWPVGILDEDLREPLATDAAPIGQPFCRAKCGMCCDKPGGFSSRGYVPDGARRS